MKSKNTLIILVVLGLFLLNAATGCTWFGSSKPWADLMKKVPIDSTSFSYWAVKQLVDDEELWDIYAKVRESSETKQLKDIGVALSSIRYSAKASGFNQGLVTVFSGDFDMKNIERELEKKGYQKSTHQETGIWAPQSGEQGYKSIALQQGIVLLGDTDSLKACLDTMAKEQEYSLYEDPDIKLLTGKLPEGVIITINKADSEESYTDLIAYGKSYVKQDKTKLKLTAIYMFQDSYSAGKARDQVKDYLGTKEFSEIKVEREESFIRATALISITNFAQSLGF
jgi:hypothetical protein